MAQWGETDTLADAPAYESPVVYLNSTDSLASGSTITIPHHGIKAGEVVLSTVLTGLAVTGLTDATEYHVISVDSDTISLAATAGGAAITGLVAAIGTMSLKVVPTDVVFVDVTEAASNRKKGLKTGGWTKYTTYVDGLGNTRHKSEVLVAMKRTAAQAGDAGVTLAGAADEDAIVADTLITFSLQPLQADAVVDIASNVDAVLTVAAAAVPAQLVTFQWEYSIDTGANWITSTSVGNGTVELTVDEAVAGEYIAGNQFRCVASSSVGGVTAADVVSSVVTLTQSV